MPASKDTLRVRFPEEKKPDLPEPIYKRSKTPDKGKVPTPVPKARKTAHVQSEPVQPPLFTDPESAPPVKRKRGRPPKDPVNGPQPRKPSPAKGLIPVMDLAAKAGIPAAMCRRILRVLVEQGKFSHDKRQRWAFTPEEFSRALAEVKKFREAELKIIHAGREKRAEERKIARGERKKLNRQKWEEEKKRIHAERRKAKTS